MSLEHEDAMQEMRDGKCVWNTNYIKEFRVVFNTECENHIFPMKCDIENFKYCPFCGGRIEVENG